MAAATPIFSQKDKIGETEVEVVEEAIPLKRFYLEISMEGLSKIRTEIDKHETWRALKTNPAKFREHLEKEYDIELSDEDAVVLNEEIIYRVYKAKVHGRNAIIISKSPLPLGKISLSLRRREDFPVYDEVPLVGDTKYAIYEIAKWLSIKTRDKDGVPLNPEDLWDLFTELVKHADICYEPCDKLPKIVIKDHSRGKVKVLNHLNDIENPKVAGKTVKVRAVVASSSITYLVPRRITINAREVEIAKTNPLLLKLIGVSDTVKIQKICKELDLNTSQNEIDEKSYWSVYLLRVRPPVTALSSTNGKIFDQEGREYKVYDVFIVLERELNLQPSTLIELTGTVLPHPKNQRVTLLVNNIYLPEDEMKYDITKIKALKEKLDEFTTIHEKIEWILKNFEIYSRIVGRKNLALAGLLCYFTPLVFEFDGKTQRGWGNILIIGDSTTGKSETVRSLIRLLGQGCYITAETASLVGLIGTAVQIERFGWLIDWGLLPLMDRKLLAIDGYQKLQRDQAAALAEAEREGVVRLTKAARDSAYARTRQIKIANPLDPSTNGYKTSNLRDFRYPAQAIATVLDKTSIARIDLAVFAATEDINPHEINREWKEEPDLMLYNLADVLKLVWSGIDVEFEEDAVRAILDHANNLIEEFNHSEIPLVSVDMKYKLARLSAALAALTLSIDDSLSKIIVRKEHVDYISEFIKNEYSKAGLNALVKYSRAEVLDVEAATEIVKSIMIQSNIEYEKLRKIVLHIVTKGRITADEIKSRFELAEKSQLRPLLSAMKAHELLKVGRGFYPTARMIQLSKILEEVEDLPGLPDLPDLGRYP